MPIAHTNTPPRVATVILLTALSPLSLNMFLPSLGNIARDLQADYALVSVAIAGYLAMTAVFQLILGPLSDRFGRRPVLLGALAVFTVASVVCSMAEDIWVFLAFRMLQGSMTAGYTLSLAIVRDTHAPEKTAGLIGYINMAMALGPMLGPILGGLLDAAFGWRSNFYLYVGTGATLLIVCWLDVGETNRNRLSKGGGMVRAFAGLMGEARFWAYAMCTAFSTGAFFVFLAGAPLVASATFGASASELGFLIGSITAGFLLGSFLAGRYAGSVSLTGMMLIGRALACTGVGFGLAMTAAGSPSAAIFFGSTIFVGLGNGITMPNSNSGAMSVRSDLAGSAAGLVAALTLAGGAALTSVTGAILTAENGPVVVLAFMLVSSAIGLVAAVAAGMLERRQGVALDRA